MPRVIYLTSPVARQGVLSLPMIDFRLTADAIDYQGCDTLMFTSKQAVVSAEAIDPNWKKLPTIAIGKATAGQIESLGGRVLYHPESFYGQVLAADVLNRFRDRQVLYLRPQTVSFDSKDFLARSGYTLTEQVIYETFCRPHPADARPQKGAIIIFTSPSTIHCFLGQFGWEESYTAVVIGRATLEHLPEGADYAVADTPLIAACVQTAKKLAK
jgi:uroporphyrinogen-III synthase